MTILRSTLCSQVALAILAITCCPATSSAHGGRFRGPLPPNLIQPPWAPTAPSVMPPRPYVPPPLPVPSVTPKRPNPGVTNPVTPRGLPMAPDPARWQLWWEMNRDRYLLVKDPKRKQVVTGDDEYYLGATRRPTVAAGPDPKLATDVILPALHKALNDSTNPHILTACLIGMAKVGKDTAKIRLRDVFVHHLSGKYQQVRETAALALGMSRQPQSLLVLQELLLDTELGRQLTKQRQVERRIRAFAAYGIGILGGEGSAAVRRRAFAVLSAVLGDPKQHDRDVKTAVISAIGVLRVDPKRHVKDKRLLWQAVPALQKFYAADLGKAAQIVQSHVPVAVARLLGRGDSADHRRYRALYRRELLAKKQNSIPQSAAIALGLLAPASDTETSDRLFAYFENGRDQQARSFSLIAMGEIGGATNRTRLLRVLTRGKKSIERPWAALALGILAHKARTARDGSVDKTVGDALLRGLKSTRNREAIGAYAIGLGLCGYQDAAKTMRTMLEEEKHHDGMTGSLCSGLALMGDHASVDSIRYVLQSSLRRPDLLRQAAIALARLRDRDADREILEMLIEDNENTARLAALAGALQFIGTQRTVRALITKLEDDQLTKLSRAFLAAALGGIADPRVLPFNECYARHVNYRALVETLSDQATGILDIL